MWGACLISATGYTGEKGFELYLNSVNYDAHKVFEGLITKGKVTN